MIDIETPLQPMKAPVLAGKKLVLAPILRAGVGFLDGMLTLVPSARVAHIGLYRDPKTLVAVEYYFKAPEDVADRLVLVLDPMLATANSAIAAVDRLKEAGAKNIRVVCLLAAPEGIEKFHGSSSRGAHLDRGDRQPSRRARLHHPGPRRRGRPDVWDEVTRSFPLPVRRGEGARAQRGRVRDNCVHRASPSPGSDLRSSPPSPR